MLEAVTRLNVKFGDKKVGVPKQVSLEADGSANSHQLWLVLDEEGLQSLATPIVLQEFVNHGGVVCVKRRSLPYFSKEKIKMKSLKGCLSFSQISDMNSSDYNKNEDGFGVEVDLERVEMPSECFELRLNLFNFDVIKDAKDGSRYLVIDVNYFPRYAKMLKHQYVIKTIQLILSAPPLFRFLLLCLYFGSYCS
ncbi:hypothetical protein ACOSQ3_031057 [Xanthoceras sorbifolium]